MKTLNFVRLMAIISCAGFVLAWTPGLPALAPSPPLVKITLKDGITIDKPTIHAETKQAIVWWIENHYADEKKVGVASFKIGTKLGDECVPPFQSAAPLRGRLHDPKVPGFSKNKPGTGVIAVVVKKNAEEGCYKYDIEASGLEKLDPRLDVP